jgi:pyrimidine-nucleoside phosphorylase
MFGDLSVDKHSTGGVGDKTTFIVAPLVAVLGGKIAKMSGRGLGHTGGTIDKLESIPGFQTTLTRKAFIDQVSRIGIAVISQSGRIAPADKKIYALRDVTATIDSIPLIASSIMSKKLAAGSKNIVLDVKFGSGAFMKSIDRARELAETMVEIGQAAGTHITAVLTNMDVPLGKAVGNALEVQEAIDVLSGGGSDDLVAVSSDLAARMLCLCHGWGYEYSLNNVRDALKNGTALRKFTEWIEAQGGTGKIIEERSLFGEARVQEKYIVRTAGYIAHMDAELIGKAACVLGAGREKAGDKIDHTAGIIFRNKTGDYCDPVKPIAVLHTSDKKLISEACRYLDYAVTISPHKPEINQLICDVIE